LLILFTNILCQCFVEALLSCPWQAGFPPSITVLRVSPHRALPLRLPDLGTAQQTRRLPASTDLPFEAHVVEGKKKIY